jgi:hypothetical protein
MAIRSTLVGVPAYNTRLLGDLSVPDKPTGIALVVHTSATNRWSPRERRLLTTVQAGRLAALRLDLLTHQESVVHAITRRLPLDTVVLSKRLVAATDWLMSQAQFAGLPMVCVGTGRGAAAAMTAAADRPEVFLALASLDGSLEQVVGAAERVRTPTLLVAAGANREIAAVNQLVYSRLRSLKQLVLVDGETTLFDEQQSIDDAGRLASDWFGRFLGVSKPTTDPAP